MQPQLLAPSEGQNLVADYASLGLTLGRHPLALLRPHLQRLRLVSAAELRELPHGKITRAAGLVISRQRPGTASGVISSPWRTKPAASTSSSGATSPSASGANCWVHGCWRYMACWNGRARWHI